MCENRQKEQKEAFSYFDWKPYFMERGAKGQCPLCPPQKRLWLIVSMQEEAGRTRQTSELFTSRLFTRNTALKFINALDRLP